MNQNINLEIKLPNVKDIELVALEGLQLMGRASWNIGRQDR